jgi:IS5 family transposase
MRPKKHETMGEGDLFRARLDQIINMKHELAQLGGKIDWAWIDGEIAAFYSDKGRPGIESHFVIGLLLLKHMFGLSDEGVCERWVYDPYFQHFTGETFFQHSFPHERSDLSYWRKRLGERLDLLLAESLRVAYESGALRTRDLARVTVDTTVQPKNITFPTDAKLLHVAIKGLNRLARRHGVRLRQSYLRVAKRAAMMVGRYAHAKQFNRHHRDVRFLRTRLGRLIRDIRRKIAGHEPVEAAFESPLSRASQIRSQRQRQRGWKLYSFHAPEVECIGKGKARAPYEFDVKARSSPPTPVSRAASSCCRPRHCRAIPTTVTPCAPPSRTPSASADARLNGPMSIPRTRGAASAAGVHLRPEARRLRHHQTRAASALRHRASHRPHEGRRPPRPLLPQGPCR